MRTLAAIRLVLALGVGASISGAPAFAADTGGCDKFKWPVARERAALAAPDRDAAESGAEFPTLPAKAVTLTLRPVNEAKLPSEPERARPGDFAGFVSFKVAPPPGSYTIGLSAGAWVDVVQDGRTLKAAGFSGVSDCEGIRKTMKFDLAAKPFVLQVSGLKEPTIIFSIFPSQ